MERFVWPRFLLVASADTEMTADAGRKAVV